MESEAPKTSYQLPPDEVLLPLIGILDFVISSIRGAATPEYADYCWELAYSVHNVPNLMRYYRREKLRHCLHSVYRLVGEYEARFHHPPAQIMPYCEQLEAYLEKTKDEDV